MLTNFKGLEVSKFGLSLLVHFKQLLDKLGVISSELLSILLKIEDCTSLALYFVDIAVVNACNFVASMLSLTSLLIITIAFLSLSRNLLLFLNVSELRLDAELVVATLLLPEGL